MIETIAKVVVWTCYSIAIAYYVVSIGVFVTYLVVSRGGRR